MPRRSTSRTHARGERGYILLSLLLMVAVMLIAAATAATSIAFKIRRDREEEMIHRGAEYSRAIRRFTKKMGRYPARLEDLENTDGIRFLRKRYKDPITGKDFKLLHMTDLQRIGVGGLSASPILPPVAPNPAANELPANGVDAQPATPPPDRSGATSDTQDSSSASNPASTAPANTPEAAGANSGVSTFNANSQPVIGGVIVGVASVSKNQSIREFNRKNHYNDWLFFYDPAFDRGFPINGPTQLTNPISPLSNISPSQPATAEPAQ